MAARHVKAKPRGEIRTLDSLIVGSHCLRDVTRAVPIRLRKQKLGNAKNPTVSTQTKDRHRLHALITARGDASRAVTAGTIDAAIFIDGAAVCNVTLRPDPINGGRLDTWGDSIDIWASDALIDYLDGLAPDDRPARIEEIVATVRKQHDSATKYWGPMSQELPPRGSGEAGET